LTGAHVIDDENLIIDDQIMVTQVACNVIADCAMVSADHASVIDERKVVMVHQCALDR